MFMTILLKFDISKENDGPVTHFEYKKWPVASKLYSGKYSLFHDISEVLIYQEKELYYSKGTAISRYGMKL